MILGQQVKHDQYGWGVVTMIDDDVIEIMFYRKILLICS